jgi:hypothetical protein
MYALTLPLYMNFETSHSPQSLSDSYDRLLNNTLGVGSSPFNRSWISRFFEEACHATVRALVVMDPSLMDHLGSPVH